MHHASEPIPCAHADVSGRRERRRTYDVLRDCDECAAQTGLVDPACPECDGRGRRAYFVEADELTAAEVAALPGDERREVLDETLQDLVGRELVEAETVDCERCGGRGVLGAVRCDATGHWNDEEECEACDGRGEVRCPSPAHAA